MRNSAFGLAASMLTALATPVAAAQDSSDWLGLDQEITNLSSSMRASAQGDVELGAYISSYFASSSDFMPTPDSDLGGFRFRAARIEASGDVSDDTSWKISFDLSKTATGGNSELKDAYADTTFTTFTTGDLVLRWGQFKEPLLYSGLSSSSRQLFIDRTMNGDVNDGRQLGAALMGEALEGEVEWALALQNGADDLADDYQVSVRGVWHVMTGLHDGAVITAFDKFQGAKGSHRLTTLSVGFAAQHDDETPAGLDRNKVAFEIEGTYNNFYGHFDLVGYDKGISDVGTHKALGGTGTSGKPGTSLAENSPYSLSASYLFGDLEQYEVALRHENHDDEGDTSRTTAGFNFYQGGNPYVKWQVNVSSFSSDDAELDGTVFEGGLLIRG